MLKIVSIILFGASLAQASNLKCKLREIVRPIKCDVYTWESYQGGWEGEDQELMNLYKVRVRDSAIDDKYCDTNVYYNYSDAFQEMKLLKKRKICP